MLAKKWISHIAILLMGLCFLVAVLLAVFQPARESDNRFLSPEMACAAARRGEKFCLRTSFRLPLIPTSDPKLWEYRGGWPGKHFPVLMRIEFADDQSSGRRAIIVGYVDRVESGVVVICHAHRVPE